MQAPEALRRPAFAIVGLAALLALVAAAGPALAHDPDFTSQFRLEDCTWLSNGEQNPYFKLRPGYRLTLEGEDETALVTVLRQTKRIKFTTPNGKRLNVITRVVEEREFEDDELVEVSRNFFARCKETSDIFYFGEEVDDFEDGELVGHEGAWLAGVDGALPGIIMPGTFLLGARYFQEIAPGVALDRGENVAMDIDITTPAGAFHDCVSVVDTDALDPEDPGDVKIYCPGVGIVMDEDLELVEIEHLGPGED
jgi:hypothetical protein